MTGLSENIDAIDAVTALQAPTENELDIKLEADKLAQRFAATGDEVLAAQGQRQSLTLDDARERTKQILDTHSNDPNFSVGSLERLKAFLDNSALFENPEKYMRQIEEAKIEILLLTSNGPYPEVCAVVDPYDDPDMPCGTIRAWLIGLGFVIIIASVNQLFSLHQPTISLEATVVQFFAYPAGKAAERFLPDVGVTLFGTQHSLNPGPLNRKEHMMISIMVSVGKTLPSSRYIIFTQWLDKYFGQPYAKSFGYQILLALSTALSAMFIYFWFSDYIFNALSLFNWLSWIAPNNFNLTAITSIKKGLGFKPLPTFDWNIVTHVADPLIVPLKRDSKHLPSAF
ncbi:OPT oligopeptide transporter protein-domain-containing protein [Aspergillus foveolatus]|uniref:OPT oligopeptide transporter protein-domain-containing protein n=1 Tax=Aspergillus foveolatus TaxID=210207 RepID=UPI003CCE4BCA